MNNTIALLEECLCNGDEGPLTLYAWFKNERHLIESTIKELNFDDENEENTPSLCQECGDYLEECRCEAEFVPTMLQNGWGEVTKEQIYNAMLVPGEYKEENGKFYIKPGMLDGYICDEYYQEEMKAKNVS